MRSLQSPLPPELRMAVCGPWGPAVASCTCTGDPTAPRAGGPCLAQCKLCVLSGSPESSPALPHPPSGSHHGQGDHRHSRCPLAPWTSLTGCSLVQRSWKDRDGPGCPALTLLGGAISCLSATSSRSRDSPSVRDSHFPTAKPCQAPGKCSRPQPRKCPRNAAWMPDRDSGRRAGRTASGLPRSWNESPSGLGKGHQS